MAVKWRICLSIPHTIPPLRPVRVCRMKRLQYSFDSASLPCRMGDRFSLEMHLDLALIMIYLWKHWERCRFFSTSCFCFYLFVFIGFFFAQLTSAIGSCLMSTSLRSSKSSFLTFAFESIGSSLKAVRSSCKNYTWWTLPSSWQQVFGNPVTNALYSGWWSFVLQT